MDIINDSSELRNGAGRKIFWLIVLLIFSSFLIAGSIGYFIAGHINSLSIKQITSEVQSKLDQKDAIQAEIIESLRSNQEKKEEEIEKISEILSGVLSRINNLESAANSSLSLSLSGNAVGGGFNLNNLSGILNTSKGGTGVGLQNITPGYLLIGNGRGFSLGTLTGTANQVNVVYSSGSIRLSTPQDIASSSSPSFAGLSLSGLISGSVLFADNSGFISQDNENLYWDKANKRLGIGISNPAEIFHLKRTDTNNFLRLDTSFSSSQVLLQGPNNPSYVSQMGVAPFIVWEYEKNILESDNNYTFAENSSDTEYLTAKISLSGFDFSIPKDSTIKGIKVEIEKKATIASEGYVRDSVVRLEKFGAVSVISSDRAKTAEDWPTEDTWMSYGGENDTWGVNWRPEDITNINFRVTLEARIKGNGTDPSIAYVDHIRVTVYYTPPIERSYYLGIDHSDAQKFKISTTSDFAVASFVIDTLGNVGIKKLSPQATLDVGGMIRSEGANFGYTALNPSNKYAISGFMIPRTADISDFIFLDSLDEFAYLHKKADSIDVSPTPSGGDIGNMFKDDTSFVYWSSGTSPFPITITIDISSNPITPKGSWIYQLGLTFRNTGHTTPTHIKIENWNTQTNSWDIVYDNDVSLGYLFSYFISPALRIPPTQGYSIYKLRVTIDGANPIPSGATFRIQRLMLYHTTAAFDPWHLHIGGGSVYGSTYLAIDSNASVGIGNTNPNSKLHISGPIATAVTTKTTNYSITASDSTVIGNPQTGNITFTLPTASGITGRIYVIKNISASYSVIVDGAGSETIDGTPTKTLQSQNAAIVIQSDGTNWIIISQMGTVN